MWFTSDHHFGHKNIIEYCNRPFSSVEEMDEELIERWNSVVGMFDLVYHLGDFTLCEGAARYFRRLNGTIFVVKGGHDRWWNSYEYSSESGRNGRSILKCDPLITIASGLPKPIVLCHYPMYSWDKSHYNSWHLYGHHHRPVQGMGGKSLNVCVDLHDFYPIHLEQVKDHMSRQENNWGFVG